MKEIYCLDGPEMSESSRPQLLTAQVEEVVPNNVRKYVLESPIGSVRNEDGTMDSISQSA